MDWWEPEESERPNTRLGSVSGKATVVWAGRPLLRQESTERYKDLLMAWANSGFLFWMFHLLRGFPIWDEANVSLPQKPCSCHSFCWDEAPFHLGDFSPLFKFQLKFHATAEVWIWHVSSPKAHVLKACSPEWCDWEAVEPLRGGPAGRS